MILSDADIVRRLEEGDLVVDPLDDPSLQIQPASVDLRLGREFARFDRSTTTVIRPSESNATGQYVNDVLDQSDEFTLHPGDFVLGTTKERVEIPADLIAHVEGRSSLGRLAIVVHSTAGLVDPGYVGEITLELSNLGNTPVALTPGMRIAQLTFSELTSPAERPYGPDRGSKYQDQSGPVPSRLNDDPEYAP